MSIPGFFEAYKLNRQIYVDGGVLYNYPLNCFDKDGINESTLGLYIGVTTDKGIDSGLSFGHPKLFAIALIESLLKAQDEDLYNSPEDMRRTIFIDSCGVSATNFLLTEIDKADLFTSGRMAVNAYAF